METNFKYINEDEWLASDTFQSDAMIEIAYQLKRIADNNGN